MQKRGSELEVGLKIGKKAGVGHGGAALNPGWGPMVRVSVTGQIPWKRPRP